MQHPIFSNVKYLVPVLLTIWTSCTTVDSKDKPGKGSLQTGEKVKKKDSASLPVFKPLDTALYNKTMLAISNGDTTGRWPVKGPYPLPGALLPFNRIVAYYGNLSSKRMGILGALPKQQMIAKLNTELAKWKAADSTTPVIPALHYIAVTAQGSPGKNGYYSLRMPFKQIDTVVKWAREIKGVVFLDIQVGRSTVKEEMVRFEKYFEMPDVHFGIDPEFSMKHGEIPGHKIGTFSADDVNTVIDYLAAIVKKNNLPPKILIVHRFTKGMLTDYKSIKRVPEVQVIIDMDGWGPKILKKSTYLEWVYRQPVQFTGFKLFYVNDIRKDKNGMYTPKELMKFTPKPVYIQYQ